MRFDKKIKEPKNQLIPYVVKSYAHHKLEFV